MRKHTLLTSLFAALPLTGMLSVATPAFAAEDSAQPSPEVANLLISAEDNLKHKKYAAAITATKSAAKASKTPLDKYLTLQTQSAVYSQSGDYHNAIQTDSELAKSPLSKPADKQRYFASIVGIGYKAKDFSACHDAALSSANMKYTALMATMAVQCPYLAHKWNEVATTTQKVEGIAEKQHATLPENIMQMDAVAEGKLGKHDSQDADYLWLAAHYPKAQYWQLAMHGVLTERGLSPRLSFYLTRLRFVTKTLPHSEVQDMIEQAVQLNLPSLAQKLLRQSAGMLPNTQTEQRFTRFLNEKVAASRKDLPRLYQEALKSTTADEPLTVGYELVLAGRPKLGLSLMKAGLQRHPHHPDQAMLSYALAEMDAGMHAQAQKDLRNIPGKGTAHHLGMLWAIQASK